jgi:hypothetical protein
VGKLAVGESARACVCARSKWNDTGIHLVPGGLYRFAVDEGNVWDDMTKRASADGYDSPTSLHRLSELLRRAPQARWFALIGALDRRPSTQFVIGSLSTLPAAAAGELTCFANDLPFMYWNNRGGIILTVTRLS